MSKINSFGFSNIPFNMILPSLSYGLYSQIEPSNNVILLDEQSIVGVGVGSLTVPANTFTVGSSFHLKIGGVLSSANNQQIIFRVKSGNVILEESDIIVLPQTTNKFWEIEIDFTIRKIGVAGVAEIFSNGQFVYLKDSSLSYEGGGFNFLNNTTFDTTQLNTLDITAEWLDLNAQNSINSEILVLTKTF